MIDSISFFITRQGGLLFIFGIAFFFNSCKNEISEIKAITDPQNLPVQTSINASYEYTENGKIVNILTAGQLDQYEGDRPYIEASNGFAMVFYDSLQQESARLTAQHGKYFDKEN